MRELPLYIHKDAVGNPWIECRGTESDMAMFIHCIYPYKHDHLPGQAWSKLEPIFKAHGLIAPADFLMDLEGSYNR